MQELPTFRKVCKSFRPLGRYARASLSPEVAKMNDTRSSYINKSLWNRSFKFSPKNTFLEVVEVWKSKCNIWLLQNPVYKRFELLTYSTYNNFLTPIRRWKIKIYIWNWFQYFYILKNKKMDIMLNCLSTRHHRMRGSECISSIDVIERKIFHL